MAAPATTRVEVLDVTRLAPTCPVLPGEEPVGLWDMSAEDLGFFAPDIDDPVGKVIKEVVLIVGTGVAFALLFWGILCLHAAVNL